jgi:N-acetylglucosaminyl-diphospho-decaprenol L-rhamnosyltransferase
MDLSLVVVHYETPQLLRRLLDSLLRSPPAKSFEILIIDNGDSNSLAEPIPENAGVTLLTMGKNVGFAKAANEGMRKAKGSYLLVSNADVEFPAKSIDSMVGALEALPRAGALGVRLEQPDGQEEVNGGLFPTILSEYRRRRMILGNKRETPGYDGIDTEAPQQRDWVTGACMLLRREAVEEVGCFDEHFFLYYEDVDLCTRLRQAGWQVYYLPTVTVIHHRGASCRLKPKHARQAYRESQRHFWRKHHGLVGLGLLELALVAKKVNSFRM